MITQDPESKVLYCPNDHENYEGLEFCEICGLPIIDYEAELDLIIRAFTEREQSLDFAKENIFIGIGGQGCKFISDFHTSWGKSLNSSEFLLIESPGDARQPVDPDPQASGDKGQTSPVLSQHYLPELMSNQVGYYGLGESLAKNDLSLDDRLRKSGIKPSARKQTIFLISALGGGTGSGATPYTFQRAKTLNPHCRSLVTAVMPAAEEPDSAHFNAFCSLSHLIMSDEVQLADMILLINHDRLMKVRGVGSGGEEIARESLVSNMLALMVGAGANRNSTQADPGYLTKISRSMGIHAFVPCIAPGRSLEIFGGLTNILQSALSCALSQVDEDSIMLSVILAQIPERLISSLKEDTIRAEFNKWNKDSFPRLKGSVIQLSQTDRKSDRIDLCLLLGGTKLAVTAKDAKDGFCRFKAVVEKGDWEKEFAVTAQNIDDIEKSVTWYDCKLDEIAG